MCKGNFDPVKVREMARNDQFKTITDGIVKQFNANTPDVVNE